MYRQVLSPLGDSLTASALVAAVPIAVLLVLLGVFRMRSHWASLCALAAAIVIAIFAYRMPAAQAGSAALEGAAFGLVPIVWIMLNAVWISKLVQTSGYFEVLRRVFVSLSEDRRLQALILAFCFGSLLESMAGFGAPVAIIAVMLMGIGFTPIRAAIVALFSDAAGTAFGSVGTPIIVMGKVTGLPEYDLGAMVGRQSPIVAFFIPLVLLVVLDGRRGVRELWPAWIATGLGFAVGQFASSNFFTFRVADLIGALTSVLAVALLLKFWSPVETIASIGEKSAVPEPTGGVSTSGPALQASAGRSGEGAWRSPVASGGHGAAGGGVAAVAGPAEHRQRDTLEDILRACSPYALLVVLLGLISIGGPIYQVASKVITIFNWPGIHVVNPKGEPLSLVEFSIPWISTTGTVLLITGLLAAPVLRLSLKQAAHDYFATVRQVRYAAVTVIAVLALAYVLNYSGQAVTIGTWLARTTGSAFALISGVLGWLGVAATGSDSSSNSLFGTVQITAASKIGVSQVLFAASNSEGGVLGKLISPQNLAMATAAVGLQGREGDLLRRLIGWSVLFLIGFCILVALQASPVLSWMVPGG